MANDLKQLKPMSCPVCDKFFFVELTEEEIINGETPNKQQCCECGWIYDLEQTIDANLKDKSNKMSLNEYKEWYQNKIKENPNWEYYKDFVGESEPHSCPLCGEYEFKDLLSYDICPICGWEDNGFEEQPDSKPNPDVMSFNERLMWFKSQRKNNPKFKKYPRKAK